jgi:CheY-like chemotaxis protein
MSGKDVNMLLVEDDVMDVRIVQRTFQKHKIANPIYVACDGVEALDMLRGHNDHTPLPRPFLILLDLNMPRMDGIMFLQTLRQDPDLHTSLVFVLTTSDDDRDKVAAYTDRPVFKSLFSLKLEAPVHSTSASRGSRVSTGSQK